MLDGSPCCAYNFLGDSGPHIAGLVDRKPIDYSEDSLPGALMAEATRAVC